MYKKKKRKKYCRWFLFSNAHETYAISLRRIRQGHKKNLQRVGIKKKYTSANRISV